MRNRKRAPASVNPGSSKRGGAVAGAGPGPGPGPLPAPASAMVLQCPPTARILQLPRLTLMEILSRLPILAVFNCRSVCKRFLHLISDPEFNRFHIARSPIGILIKTIPPTNDAKRLQVAQIEDGPPGPGSEFQVTKLSFTPKDNIPTCKFSQMNSCNGLLCLSGSDTDDPIYVCNPVLGEFVAIAVPHRGRTKGSFWGLGCCPVTGLYKVLQTFYPVTDTSCSFKEAEIYTLGTGTWRRIGVAPKDLVSLPFNAFLNGALHWVPCTPNGSEFIHTFDFAREQFSWIPPPSHFVPADKKYTNSMRIGVLQGCLFIIKFNDSLRFDIWIMKEYGVQESWTKQFVVENLYPKHSSWDFYEPIISLKSGEILMLYNNDLVVCYNPKRKSVRRTKFFRTRSAFSAVALTPSFISLFNVANGEKISRMREPSKVHYDIQNAGDFHNCDACGVIMNSSYNLAAFDTGLPITDYYPANPDGRNPKTLCGACGSHLMTPDKSFLSLWS